MVARGDDGSESLPPSSRRATEEDGRRGRTGSAFVDDGRPSPPLGDEPSLVPRRATLAPYVAARRYERRVSADAEGREEIVVLHDMRSAGIVILGPREWTLVRCADGTRDGTGIRLAARARAVRAGAESVDEFLRRLSEQGLLVEGPPVSAGAPDGPSGAARGHGFDPGGEWGAPRRDAPLAALPDFELRCDGHGSCCRIYGSTLFSPAEAALAIATCTGGSEEAPSVEGTFTPVAGSTYRLDEGAERARCVAVVDGACAFLSADGRCRIHTAAGARSKPLGCRSFPRAFVDDGAQLRVSVRPDCACVLRSLSVQERGPGAERLVEPGSRTGADLDPNTAVRILPEAIEIAPDLRVARDRFVAWADSWAEQLRPEHTERAGSHAQSGVAWTWAVAMRIERDGDLPAVEELRTAAEPQPAVLRGAAGRLVARLEALSGHWQRWRSVDDLSVATAGWIASAARRLADDGLAVLPRPTLPALRREAFCLRAWLHGHLLVEHAPLCVALRDAAMRLALARLMAGSSPPRTSPSLLPVADEPLALLNGWLGAHGIPAWTSGRRS